MQMFDRGAALRIVSGLGLAPANRAIADHWLSLWTGAGLPDRSALRPASLKALLPNLVLFDVVPGRSVVVRLAGTTMAQVLGVELTGRDWIESAPREYRPQRLRIFSDIAHGAIGRGVRKVEMKAGGSRTCEEILLPFRGKESQLVVCHVDWDTSELTRIASREQACGPALAFETVPLPFTKAA